MSTDSIAATRTGPTPRLLTEQVRPAATMLAGGAWSLVPPGLRRLLDDPDQPVTMQVATGSDQLLDAHAAWAGAPPGRYRDTVPPHTFARWAMPVIARVTAKAPLGLLAVLNQGVDVRIHHPIPRGTDVVLEGRFDGVVHAPGRNRIDSSIAVRLPDGTEAMHLQVHAVVPTEARRGARRAPPEREWEQVGSFAVDRQDGKRFFWLTGDPNPIHTVEAVGRLTRFDGCILHGFGTMARTWEVLVDSGEDVTDIRVRFTAPNPIPNQQVVVERATAPDDDGRRRVRARGTDGTAYLVASLA